MIRINLLRTMGVSGVGTNIGTSASSGGDIISVDVRRQAAIKVAIILLFPTLLFIWEKLRLNSLQSDQVQIQQKVTAVEAERASFGSTAPRVAKANKLKEKMTKEIKIIRELARNRLREVKALDQLQTILPDKTWISAIKIEGSKITMDGYALNESAITELMTALNTNAFFSGVQPKGQVQETNKILGQVTKFGFEFRVGNSEEN
ncbi:MAG: PilN domain-containing protein [Bdellovibrionales bacterium]|jgi:Tfp pilus assembly protein PilN|nr:PilN domain-containing protein [Bdellovibrionales bacterium]